MRPKSYRIINVIRKGVPNMSYKNLQLTKWVHPKTQEIRFYVNTQYVDPRGSMIAYAGGGFLYEGEDGSISWDHGKCPFGALEDRGDGLIEVIGFLTYEGREPIDFKTLISRLDDPVFTTKSGKFSATKWAKYHESLHSA